MDCLPAQLPPLISFDNKSRDIAPYWVTCPDCLNKYTRVYVLWDYNYLDAWIAEYYDDCGFYHVHDESFHIWYCECRYGHQFTVRENAIPCMCGWPDDPHQCDLEDNIEDETLSSSGPP